MPAEFADTAAADAWRAANCPPRVTVTNAPPPAPTPRQVYAPEAPSGDGYSDADTPLPNIPSGGSFEARVLAQADAIVDTAYQQVQTAPPTAVAIALRNWSEAAKQGSAAKAQVQALQIEQRELLRLDDALECVSVLLQSVRRRILKLGERAAAAANPSDPAVAKAAIDREVDMLLAELGGASQSITSTLSGGLPEDAEEGAE